MPDFNRKLPKQIKGKLNDPLNNPFKRSNMPKLSTLTKKPSPSLAQDKPKDLPSLTQKMPSMKQIAQDKEPSQQERQNLVKQVMAGLVKHGQRMKQNNVDFTSAELLKTLIDLIENIVGKDNPNNSKFVAHDLLNQYGNKLRGQVKLGLKKHFDLAY